MKKSVKVISTLLLAIMLVASITGTVLAADVPGILNQMNGNGNMNTNQITSVGNNVVTIIQVVGVVTAVIILLIIGIKYMMGSASEKAEYKKTMIPYLVGAILIFGASAITKVVVGLAQGITG